MQRTTAELALEAWNDLGADFTAAAVKRDSHTTPGWDVIERYEYLDGSALIASGDFVDFGIHRDRLKASGIGSSVSTMVDAAISRTQNVHPVGTPPDFVGATALLLDHLAYPEGS